MHLHTPRINTFFWDHDTAFRVLDNLMVDKQLTFIYGYSKLDFYLIVFGLICQYCITSICTPQNAVFCFYRLRIKWNSARSTSQHIYLTHKELFISDSWWQDLHTQNMSDYYKISIMWKINMTRYVTVSGYHLYYYQKCHTPFISHSQEVSERQSSYVNVN